MTDPSPFLPDARGGGVLCFCASDAGVPPEGAVQTKHGRAGTLHLPVWVSAAGKEEAVQSVNEDEACSVRIIHRGAANHLFMCPAHCPRTVLCLFESYDLPLFIDSRSNFLSWTCIFGPRVSTHPCTPRPGSLLFSSPSSLSLSPHAFLIYSCMR